MVCYQPNVYGPAGNPGSSSSVNPGALGIPGGGQQQPIYNNTQQPQYMYVQQQQQQLVVNQMQISPQYTQRRYLDPSNYQNFVRNGYEGGGGYHWPVDGVAENILSPNQIQQHQLPSQRPNDEQLMAGSHKHLSIADQTFEDKLFCSVSSELMSTSSVSGSDVPRPALNTLNAGGMNVRTSSHPASRQLMVHNVLTDHESSAARNIPATPRQYPSDATTNCVNPVRAGPREFYPDTGIVEACSVREPLSSQPSRISSTAATHDRIVPVSASGDSENKGCETQSGESSSRFMGLNSSQDIIDRTVPSHRPVTPLSAINEDLTFSGVGSETINVTMASLPSRRESREFVVSKSSGDSVDTENVSVSYNVGAVKADTGTIELCTLDSDVVKLPKIKVKRKRRKPSAGLPSTSSGYDDVYDSVTAVINAVAAGDIYVADDCRTSTGHLLSSDIAPMSVDKARGRDSKKSSDFRDPHAVAGDESHREDGMRSPVMVPFGWKRQIMDEQIFYSR